jgi:hypothetical protein
MLRTRAPVVLSIVILALASACGTDPAPGGDAGGGAGPPVDAAAPGDGPGVVRDLPPYERPPAAPPLTGHGFTAKDLGDLGANPGRLTVGGGVVVRAGGMDIGGTADSCAFVYRKLRGDGEIVARLRSVQRADATSTAGIMVRADDTDPAAPSVFFGVLADPVKGGQFVHRTQRGQAAQASAPDPQVRNQYLRLRREGRRFTLARSGDRIAWVKVGAVDVDMPEEVPFGLAVSARSATAPTTGEYDFVRLLALDAAAARDGWDLEPLGLAGPLPTAAVAGDRISVSGVADAFTTTIESGAALLAPRMGPVTLTARVDSLGDAATPGARVALTFREGGPGRLVPTSRNILISVTAQGVVQFQRRDRSTNFDAGMMKDGLRPPVWLRLARYDDPVTARTTVTGSYSTDGVNFIRLDGADFAIPDPAMAGVIFTPGSSSNYGSAQLSGWSVTPTQAPPAPGPAPDARPADASGQGG